MGGVAAFMGRYAGLEFTGYRGFLWFDRFAQLGRVVFIQQVGNRVLHEIRVAQVAVAVHIGVAHGFDLIVHALGRVIAQFLHRIAFEDVHDLADHHAAGARWRCRDHVVATVVALDGRQFAGLVFVEVGLGDDALVGLAGGDDGVGHPAFIETVGAFLGDLPQGLAQVLLHQLLADLHRLAVAEEDRAGILDVLLEHVGGVVQQIDIPLLQHETVFGQLDGRGDDFLARLGAVLGQRQFHARNGARHTHGQVATGTQIGNDVALLVQVHVGGCGQRRFFTEVEEGLAPVRQLNGHETTAAEVACRGVHHCQRIADRDRCVDGVAAVLEHIHADMAGQVLGGDHHAVFPRRRGHGGSVSSQAAESQ
ncbi:hypothetical protein D9M71_306570 [compost metagenome]